MTPATASPPPLPIEHAQPPEKTLYRLFLTLFLRGRSSRGLQSKQHAPTNIVQKFALIIGLYFLFGFIAIAFINQSIFALSVYLHATTFAFIGMFLASSAGEVLFNKEEADILLHRPIDPRVLLWAKVRVLVESALWISLAFNFAGFFVGLAASNASWLFFPAHAISLTLESAFCAGCVVMVYQLCLRWFGRERLDGLITLAQVMVAVGAVLAGQLLPQLVLRMRLMMNPGDYTWWIAALPPAWFAGLDDLIAGDRTLQSAVLAAGALIMTASVLWVAFGILARDYDTTMQTLSEATAPKRRAQSGRRWFNAIANIPPLRWILRDPVSRASFVLTTAYLLRDRDVKLRVYPAVAPMLIVPVAMFMNAHRDRDFGFDAAITAFVGAFLGVLPASSLSILRYSQQWQAADVFHAAPMKGPAPISQGARWAVQIVLALPITIAFASILLFMHKDLSQLLLMLPGIIAMPVLAIAMTYDNGCVPLSMPSEEAKNMSRGLVMMLITFSSFPIAGVSAWAWYTGWFHWFLAGELVLAIGVYLLFRANVNRMAWRSLE
ncbi:MAG: hypothetical protein IT367_09475 [Candidatus Hydrogenedentes bacterium]|nr:hypothetical protein [Candidatus Hydrogenedentota bacterium]